MARLHILRVFTAEDGSWGNPLGVFLDGAEVAEDRRQAVAHRLGFSETVFVDDPGSGACRIFTPGLELPFAGHPTPVLRPPAGEVKVRREGALTFVAARAEWSPPWALLQLRDPAAVEELEDPPPGEELPYLWAWQEEAGGTVRSRCLSLDDGVGEDEATGSAAIMLCAELGRELTIHQGRGSLLHARPLGEGRAEVGGRVVLDEVRDHPVQINI